jgi:hypothetical protein
MSLHVPFLLLLLSTAPASSPSSTDLAKLTWLTGTWTGVSDGVTMEETWSSAQGGGMLAMHKDTKEGRMTSFDFFRVSPDSAGRPCYYASPLGRTPVAFCAIELGKSRVVFENREHDFPQRILYWLQPDGRLHARIEGTIGGREQAEDWTWTRSPGR